MPNRTPEPSAEAIVMLLGYGRKRLVGGRVKRVVQLPLVRIERGVLVKPIRRSVKSVCAGLGDHRDLAARCTPKRGVRIIHSDAVLLHRFCTKRNGSDGLCVNSAD